MLPLVLLLVSPYIFPILIKCVLSICFALLYLLDFVSNRSLRVLKLLVLLCTHSVLFLVLFGLKLLVIHFYEVAQASVLIYFN